MIDSRKEFKKIVAANRILAHEGVVDSFGHVSIRHPDNKDHYAMARARSPEWIEFDDLMEFKLNGEAIDPQGRKPYSERAIHGAVYESREEINAVVHNHSNAVLPFCVANMPLYPVVHTCSIIGKNIPIWDIQGDFGETNMLVSTLEQGRSLVETLGQNTCALLRGHGAVIVGRTVEEAVMTAVYLEVNARVQMESMQMGEVRKLSAKEIDKCAKMLFSPIGIERTWENFCMRAGIEPFN